MREYLQFGMLCYLTSIGLEAYLAANCIRRKLQTSFTVYSCFFTAQAVILFTLLSKGNGGLYRSAYWASEYIQDALLAWVAIDCLWRRTSRDYQILSGVIVAVLFPMILQFRSFAPLWTQYIPVFAFLVAQVIWVSATSGTSPQSSR